MSESTIRDAIEITLGGKTYSFARPVIARRREFQKDSLRLAEIFEQLDFTEQVHENGFRLPASTAKNMRLFIEIAEQILKTLADYSPAIKNDQAKLRERFNLGEITETEISTEWGKLKEFVQAPFAPSRESAAPADTSSSG